MSKATLDAADIAARLDQYLEVEFTFIHTEQLSDVLAGMPRRIPDYSTQFTDFNTIASIGAIGFGLSQLVFVAVLLTAKKGAKADDRVWEGAHGLEWTVPSPAPWHTFTTPPKARIANEAFE